jgi:hypothetical protein
MIIIISISISNFKDPAASNSASADTTSSEVYSKSDGSTSDNTATVSEEVYLKDLINRIETNNSFNGNYKLVSSNAFDDNYWNLDWERNIGNGILNPHDSLKVTVNRHDYSIAAYNRFNMTPNTTQPIISESEALTAAQPVLNTISNVNSKTLSLTVTRPNYFWNDGGPYKTADFARLAYKISVNNDAFKIYIDAVTGENLGGSISKSENGKAFAYSGLDYAQECADLANNGLRGLGYNMLPEEVTWGSVLGTDIQNYWNGSASYAFYVDCHGTPTYITDNTDWWLYTTNVVGNWHFVFLDACQTGVNTGWANAFKINGYSKRAFLGWFDIVDPLPAEEFDGYFWPEAVHQYSTKSIEQAAVWAADQVSGYTPIRFYGDNTYNGRAWS